MKYDPNIHHRRSIRLQEYDYSQYGAYFVTICTKNKRCLFGEIVNDKMVLNKYGVIAIIYWFDIPKHFPGVELDEFIVMPNHIHGIIMIQSRYIESESVGAGFTPAHNRATARVASTNNNSTESVGAGFTPAHNRATARVAPTNNNSTESVGAGFTPAHDRATARVAPTIGDIVGAYKSLVSNECLKMFKSKNEFMGKIWQRNYYEHIIRDEKSVGKLREYIFNNPFQWINDDLFIKKQ
ncbi:hypothetical protein ISS30_05745 [bacterium]|nr:hypothetical protein [bacterium]